MNILVSLLTIGLGAIIVVLCLVNRDVTRREKEWRTLYAGAKGGK